jgi:small redox-active disulfide protein 2
MRLLQVLGPGCPRCEKLRQHVQAAVEQLGIEAAVEKVTDIGEINSFDVMTTPALVIDGEVRVVGSVPSVDEIKQLLSQIV